MGVAALFIRHYLGSILIFVLFGSSSSQYTLSLVLTPPSTITWLGIYFIYASIIQRRPLVPTWDFVVTLFLLHMLRCFVRLVWFSLCYRPLGLRCATPWLVAYRCRDFEICRLTSAALPNHSSKPAPLLPETPSFKCYRDCSFYRDCSSATYTQLRSCTLEPIENLPA